MPNKGKNYGNASQVTTHIDDYGGMKYADGGAVNPQGKQSKDGMPKPEKGKTPKRITTKNKPGGPHTPGAKKGYADGGKVGSKKRKKPKPKMLGTGSAAGAARAVSGRQRQIDKALEDAGA